MTADESGATHSEAARREISPETLGARLQRLRLRQGFSVRDVAHRAEVDKNTVVRLEKGLPVSARTLDRVCSALGLYVSRLALPDPEEGELVALHSRAHEAWWPYPGMGEPQAAPLTRFQPLGSIPVEERYRDTENRSEEIPVIPVIPEVAARGYVMSLACRMPYGRLRSSLLRLYDETTPNSHPGEEMVFCLSGDAKVKVAGKSYALSEGEAATFWCAEPHTYAPQSGPLPFDGPPVLLLTVWIDAREERK